MNNQKQSDFEKFNRQLKACANLSFSEFCDKSGVSPGAAEDLLTSQGGLRYLFERLEEIRADTLTIGDVVEHMHAKGAEVTLTPSRLYWYFKPSKERSVKINLPYEQLQEVLCEVHLCLSN
jgi:hypothetical protein